MPTRRAALPRIQTEKATMKRKAESSNKGGYVDTAGGSDGKTWIPKVGDVLEGVVMGVKTLDAKKSGRKKAKKGETVKIVSVADSDGALWAVWESKGLTDFCTQAKPRMKCRLELLEVKNLGGGKKFKRFYAGLKK
jgi:hypothetical protein